MDPGLLKFRPHKATTVQSVILPLTPAPGRLSPAETRALGFFAAFAVHTLVWAAYCWPSSPERLPDRNSDRTSASLLTVSVSLSGPMPATAVRGFVPRLIELPRGVATSLRSLTNLQIAPGYTAPAALPEPVVRQNLEEAPSIPPAVAGESPAAAPKTDTVAHGSTLVALPRQAPRAPKPLPGQALPEYPESAREDGREGLVVLAVEVDADGRVLAVTWERRSGVPVLDYAARQVILHWRFQPAHDGLGPVVGHTRVSVRFSLRAAQAVAIAQAQP